ncbi:MAG TPA: hypothetical protein ENH29_01900 [Bacteroidetes bacterium]|nr:hypothetical protein [Bacteroidota bacterium]
MIEPEPVIDYRAEMRKFVQDISAAGKRTAADFLVIPQNGHDLITYTGDADGRLVEPYLYAIDALGREDLFFGYNRDDEQTPQSARSEMISFLNLAKEAGKTVLITDYCWTRSKIDSSYHWNDRQDYLSFAADHRELDHIPDYPAVPYKVNSADILSLKDAKNFLYLLNAGKYVTKTSFLDTLRHTDYDVLVIDLFFQDDDAFTKAEITLLKQKQNGSSRLVIAYMSIGEAENYRYYWRPEWENNPPNWLLSENPDWPGNYKVKYWNNQWQQIIVTGENSYLQKIINAGFDGVYLDIIDAFEYFER